MDGTILIADDDRTIRTVLTQALTRAGCKVHATSSLMTLMRWVEEGMGDLVISDVIMPDGNGLDALPRITRLRPGLPVIVISAQNTIMTAIQATEAQAFDYLPKPFDLPDLMKRCARALDQKRPSRPNAPAPRPVGDDLPLIGRSPVMQGLYRLVARVMNTDLGVLITGESGTGKSLLARAVHDLSDRRAAGFVVAQTNDLSGPEGAATLLARARGGTLLLDEVADLDDATQARVVRLLDIIGTDDPQSAPRVMATSQVDLAQRIQAGRFRQDLFYRLGMVTLHVPALRDRVEDIALLTNHFLARDSGPIRQLSPEAADLLRTRNWPGNVRQLENTIRRLLVTATEPLITRAELALALDETPAADRATTAPDQDRLSASVARHLQRYFDLHGDQLPPPGVYQRVLRELETPLIEIALEATAGNQAKCADLLGINRNTLRKKITDLDIRVTRGRKLM